MQERFSTFTLLIAKLSKAIRKIKTEEMSQFNLKSPHVSCLYYLHKQGELTATKLCDICNEDKAAVSRTIDYLEKHGYLYCDSNARKRYNSPLKLTEMGGSVAVEICGKIDRILGVASQGLSEEDREIMYKCLAVISKNLTKVCQNYGD